MLTKEQDLYPDIAAWLRTRLRSLYSGWSVEVFDTSRFRLSTFLERTGVGLFPGSEAFEIEVDITGVLRRGSAAQLAFVECKAGPISLNDVGQILGYSRVASPTLSAIISPRGISSSLDLLLSTYNRVDILEYGSGKRIKIETWDLSRKQVDPTSVLPAGELG